MGALHRGRLQIPLVVLGVCGAAVAILWFLIIAIRSFYPVQAGAGLARVDGGLLFQGALALVCAGVAVALLSAPWSARRGDRALAAWLAGALALIAVLVALALTAERFIHPVPPMGDSAVVYSGEAGLWATYFWTAAAAVTVVAVLQLLNRATRRSVGPNEIEQWCRRTSAST